MVPSQAREGDRRRPSQGLVRFQHPADGVLEATKPDIVNRNTGKYLIDVPVPSEHKNKVKDFVMFRFPG